MHQQYHNKTNSSLNKAYFLVACIHLNWGHSQCMWTQDWKTTTKAIIKIDNLFKVISHFSQIIIQTIQLFYSLFWVFMLPLYSKQIVWCHHLCNISKFTINVPMKNIHFDNSIACMKKKKLKQLTLAHFPSLKNLQIGRSAIGISKSGFFLGCCSMWRMMSPFRFPNLVFLFSLGFAFPFTLAG